MVISTKSQDDFNTCKKVSYKNLFYKCRILYLPDEYALARHILGHFNVCLPFFDFGTDAYPTDDAMRVEGPASPPAPTTPTLEGGKQEKRSRVVLISGHCYTCITVSQNRVDLTGRDCSKQIPIGAEGGLAGQMGIRIT
ncbi:hypothetical protein BGZ63DRAFT_93669 [Mariannaea sp. PMI_226]|nr:hypothetical protein BGZ63DRAFT_93669 [Mariannaea sp. PMI_226]